MPLEMVVRAARVARRADVADHVARLYRSELPERRQMRVVYVAELPEHLDREAPDVVRRRGGLAVERSHDRDPHRRVDVVALMDVVAALLGGVVDHDPEVV